MTSTFEELEKEIDRNHLVFDKVSQVETTLALLGSDQSQIDVAINDLQMQVNTYNGELGTFKADIRIDKAGEGKPATCTLGFRTALYNDVVMETTFSSLAFIVSAFFEC